MEDGQTEPAASDAGSQPDVEQGSSKRKPSCACGKPDAAPEQGGSKHKPTCLCGLPHWFRQCPYVVPSNRKPGWTADTEIQRKFDAASKKQKAQFKRAQEAAERASKRR
jgi:hypothetical protein